MKFPCWQAPPCPIPMRTVCWLTGLLPGGTPPPARAQSRSVLERMETALQRKGMTFAHVVRTWFYLDRMLEWYGEFNTARSGFFNERNVFAGVLPASNGHRTGQPGRRGADRRGPWRSNPSPSE